MINYTNTIKVVQDWANNVEKSCSIYIDKKNDDLYIYTRYPGYFIGPKGQTVENYRKILNDLGWKKVVVKELYYVVSPRKKDEIKANIVIKGEIKDD